MICRQCGTKISDSARFCRICGTPVSAVNAAGSEPAASLAWASDGGTRYAEHGADNTGRKPDARSGGFAFLCFCIPIVGLILYLVWKDQYPLKAKSCGKGALIGVIAWPVLYIGFHLAVYGAILARLQY